MPGLLDLLSQTWPARLAQDAWGGVTLPRDVYQGKINPLSPEAIARTNSLAGLMVGAPGAPAGALGSSMRRLPVKPSSDDLSQLMEASFKYGAVGPNKTVPISKLSGGLTPNQEAKVADLASQMSGPDGYVSRLVVDDAGNVIEGQHRLAALKRIGETTAPVSVIRDLSRGFDVQAMEQAVSAAGKLHPDQVKGIVQGALEAITSSGGSPQKALAEYQLPTQWQPFFEAALNAATPTK